MLMSASLPISSSGADRRVFDTRKRLASNLRAGGGTSGSVHGWTRVRPWTDVARACESYAGGMSAEKMIGTLTARWRRAGHPDFAWWIPLLMDGFACAAGAVAVGQRSEQGALLPATLLGLVALTPWFLDFAGIRMHWLAFMTVTIAATSVLMARYPVDYDFAMLVWVLMVGHIGASETLARSLMATTLAVVALGLLAL